MRNRVKSLLASPSDISRARVELNLVKQELAKTQRALRKDNREAFERREMRRLYREISRLRDVVVSLHKINDNLRDELDIAYSSRV